jgi:hypothetical protein
MEDSATLILCPVLPSVRAAPLCFKVPQLLMEVERKCVRSQPRNYLVVSAKLGGQHEKRSDFVLGKKLGVWLEIGENLQLSKMK